MSERFEIGEVAIYVKPGAINYGVEVTITGPLMLRKIWDTPTKPRLAECYLIDGSFISLWAPPTGRWCSEPQYLRKKGLPSPKEELGEWDLCPWQPKKRVHEQT